MAPGHGPMSLHEVDQVLDLIGNRATATALAIQLAAQIILEIGRTLTQAAPVRKGLSGDTEEGRSLGRGKSALIVERGRGGNRCGRHIKNPFPDEGKGFGTARYRVGNPCSVPHGRHCYPSVGTAQTSAPLIPSRAMWEAPQNPQTANLIPPQAHPLTSEISRCAEPLVGSARRTCSDPSIPHQIPATPPHSHLNQGNSQCYDVRHERTEEASGPGDA